MKHVISLLLLMMAVMGVTAQKSTSKPKAAVKKSTTKATVKKEPGLAELKKKLADLRPVSTEDCDKILVLADKILKLNPSDTECVIKKTVCLGRAGNHDEVIGILEKFYQPADSAASIIGVFPFLADLEMTEANRYPYYDAAIRIAPNNGIGYVMKATEQADAKQFKDALINLEKGYGLLPAEKKESFKPNYAFILTVCGEHQRALDLAMPALKENPAQYYYLQAAVSALYKTNRGDEALQQIDKAIATDSTYEFLRMKLDMLSEMKQLDKACAIADQIHARFDGYTWLKNRLYCPDVLANAVPDSSTVYEYDVKAGENTYTFTMSKAQVNMESGIQYNWSMSMNDDMKGTVTINKEALASARDQMNRYMPGDHHLTNQTSVWVSKAVYEEIKSKETTRMNLSGTEKVFKIVTFAQDRKEQQVYEGEVVENEKDKVLKVIHLRSEDGTENIWINDDPANPLITRMIADFEIGLYKITRNTR